MPYFSLVLSNEPDNWLTHHHSLDNQYIIVAHVQLIGVYTTELWATLPYFSGLWVLSMTVGTIDYMVLFIVYYNMDYSM